VLVRQDTLDMPYSRGNEIRFFFVKGIPLCLSNLFNWGLPSIFSMVMAGHTQNSAELQAAFGFGRVWYNITCIMPFVSMMSYANYLLPMYIGAGRRDRVPLCLWRGLTLSFMFMLPLYALQFVSGPILQFFGVPPVIAAQVATYNRIMVITSILNIFDGHIGALIVQNGYARSATVVSFAAGTIQMICSYLFLYRWAWGMVGAALAQIVVRLVRISLQGFVVWNVGLWRQLVIKELPLSAADGRAEVAEGVEGSREPFLSWQEVEDFISKVGWSMLSNLAGWFVFELQMMILANIAGISPEALAAGSAWIQMESAFAAQQEGWLQCMQMRVLRLLGQQDIGAGKAFWTLEALSDGLVGITNVCLFVWKDSLCRIISNDEAVQAWLDKIIWVLIIHTQSRIGNCNSANLLIPLDRGRFKAVATFVGFYCVASPISAFVALTDYVTTSMSTKMVACVGLTSMAQLCLLVTFYIFLCGLDWQDACAIVKRQADSDRQKTARSGDAESAAVA